MNACTRSSTSRRSVADDDHRQAVLADALDELAAGRRGPAHREQAARVDLQRAEQLAQHPREVLAQPRHAAELQRVRHLVQRDPAQQLVGRRVERRSRRARGWARRTAAARAASGSSTGNSYWPSTRPARKPEIAPASIASSRRRRAERPELPPTRSAAGSSTVSSDFRLASIQPPRSTASATGTGWAGTSPV